MASRIATRSTMHGTPVKSCISTRAGVNCTSVVGSAAGSQPASASIWPAVTQQVLQQHLEAVRQSL